MARYVLMNRGRGRSMVEARELLRGFDDIVIEQQDEDQLLVSGPSQSVQRLTRELEGWVSALVRSIPRPSIGAMRHPRVRRP